MTNSWGLGKVFRWEKLPRGHSLDHVFLDSIEERTPRAFGVMGISARFYAVPCYLSLTSYYSFPSSYCLLLSHYYLLHTTYYLLPTTLRVGEHLLFATCSSQNEEDRSQTTVLELWSQPAAYMQFIPHYVAYNSSLRVFYLQHQALLLTTTHYHSLLLTPTHYTRHSYSLLLTTTTRYSLLLTTTHPPNTLTPRTFSSKLRTFSTSGASTR